MNKAIEKTKLIIEALRYAQKHNLDISSREDVKKILEDIDPQSSSEEDIKVFMGLLQDTGTFIDKMNSEKDKEKTNLPN